MTISFDLPVELERRLTSEMPDLGSQAREAFALDLFRRECISHAELGKILGLSAWDTSALLQRRKIYEQSMTLEDIATDVRTLERLGVGQVKL